MTVVAIQGERECYSHDAARRALGPDVDVRSCGTFADVFDALAAGRTSLACVPVDNTILGPIAETRGLIEATGARPVGSARVTVRHCLIVRRDQDPARIRRIASHPAALAQCRRFLEARPDWTAVTAADTAGSVRALAEGTIEAEAAIASRRAAGRYGCRVALEGIQDAATNLTRFLVVTIPG